LIFGLLVRYPKFELLNYCICKLYPFWNLVEKHSLAYGRSPSTQIHLIWNWSQGYSFLKAEHRKQNYSLFKEDKATRIWRRKEDRSTDLDEDRIRNSQNFNSDFLCYSNFLKHLILGKSFIQPTSRILKCDKRQEVYMADQNLWQVQTF